MSSRSSHAVIGLVVGAVVDIIINLLASGIQQRAFSNQFSTLALLGLAGLALVGLLVGYWLGGAVTLPSSSTPQPPSIDVTKPDTVTITRLRAILSYSKLRGKGIHLSDILLIGSRIDIDT